MHEANRVEPEPIFMDSPAMYEICYDKNMHTRGLSDISFFQ